MKEPNPNRFLEAAEEIYAAAKDATIELLRAQGEKCFVVNFEKSYWVITGDAYTKECNAVGLDKNGELIIGGTTIVEAAEGLPLYSPDCYDSDFEDTELLRSYSYPKLYAYVASHLPEDAVTREEAERMLKEYSNDYNADFEGEDDDLED